MARSLIGGLIARGASTASIRVAEPVEVLRESLARDFGVQVFATAAEAAADADLWMLAVKPQVMRIVCEGLSAARPIAQATGGLDRSGHHRPADAALAGRRQRGHPRHAQHARPAGRGRDRPVRQRRRSTRLVARAPRTLLSSAGMTVWIDDEAKMDAVTAVSGSGPAYVFLLAEAMEAAARAEGLADDAARTLVLQTVLGAARMLTESDEAPGELRKRVTSPNGTTQAAIDAFQQAASRSLSARRSMRRASAAGNCRRRMIDSLNRHPGVHREGNPWFFFEQSQPAHPWRPR